MQHRRGQGKSRKGLVERKNKGRGRDLKGGEINWHWEGRKMKSSWRESRTWAGESPSTDRARQGARAVGPQQDLHHGALSSGHTICCTAQLCSCSLFPSRKGSVCIEGKHFFPWKLQGIPVYLMHLCKLLLITNCCSSHFCNQRQWSKKLHKV